MGKSDVKKRILVLECITKAGIPLQTLAILEISDLGTN